MSHDGSDAYTGDQFAPDTSKKDLLRQERVKAKNRYAFFNQHFPQWCAASSTPFTICRSSLIPSVIQRFAVQFCAAESKHSSLPCCRRAQKKYREKKMQEVDLYKVQVGVKGQQQDLWELLSLFQASSGILCISMAHQCLHACADQGAQCKNEANGGRKEGFARGQRQAEIDDALWNCASINRAHPSTPS